MVRSVLPGCRHRGARRDDGTRRRGGLWATPCAQRGPARSSLGPNQGQDRLPRWQGGDRAAAGARARGQGTGAAELGAGGRGGLARQVGDEPDADQRLDAEVPPSGAAARGRCSGAGGGRRIEVGGLAPLRRAVGCAHEGVDGCGSVRARHPGGADRRHPHERRPRAGGGDRDRRRGRASIRSGSWRARPRTPPWCRH